MRYRLSFGQYGILLGLFVLIFAWVLVDQYFFPLVIQRFAALIVVALAAITTFFFIVKPAHPYGLATHLGLVIGVLALGIALVEHLIVRFDFSIRSLLIVIIAFVCPFPSALIYKRVKRATTA